MTRAATRQPVGNGTELWHGTASGYNQRGCGCDRCRLYISQKRSENRHRQNRDLEPARIRVVLTRLVERCAARVDQAAAAGDRDDAERWQRAAEHVRAALREVEGTRR